VDKKSCDKVALNALIENGISGWLNNITEEEKRQALNFLQDPVNFNAVAFAPEKVVNCPILVSRISRIVDKYGALAVNIINELLWGIPEDGKNKPMEFKRALELALYFQSKRKGGK